MLLSASKLHSLIIKGHPLKSLSLRKCITILWNLLKKEPIYLGPTDLDNALRIDKFSSSLCGL